MNVFVINLKQDGTRRAHMEALLRRINLEFEFFQGVNGRELTDAERKRDYDERKAMRTQCRALVPAEIGCALSHLAVYREIIRRGLPMALVLEDDVLADERLPEVLDAIETLPLMSAPSVVLLSPAEGQLGDGRLLSKGVSLSAYRSGFYTHAYVVTLAAARALLKELYPVGDVADCWRRMQKHRVVDVFVVRPPLVTQQQSEFGSSTTLDQRAAIRQRTFLQKIHFKTRRAFWFFSDGLFALYHRTFTPYCGMFGNDSCCQKNKGS